MFRRVNFEGYYRGDKQGHLHFIINNNKKQKKYSIQFIGSFFFDMYANLTIHI